MFVRKVATVALIAGSALMLPALPGQAAPSGGCPYPPNRPVLSIGLSPATVSAGSATIIFGTFKQNNCGIRNATILLQRRALINGQPSGSWFTYTTRTTNTNGVWSQAAAPMVNRQVRAVFNATGKYPRTVSRVVTLFVRTRITIHPTTLSRCRIQLTGLTLPAKSNRRVFIQQRGPKGQFQGWSTIGSTKTRSGGKYLTIAAAKCGTTYNLGVFIYGDATNLAGRSGTIFGIKPHH